MENNIQFNDEQQSQNPRFLYSRLQVSTDKPGVVNFLIKHKVAKGERTANFILLGVTVLFLILSVFFFTYDGTDEKKVINQSLDPFNMPN